MRLAAKHRRRFVRFGLVGASGVLVNTVLLYTLAEIGALSPLVAAALATEAAILSNFILNDRFTFSDVQRKSLWRRRALQYNATALGGLLVSIAVLAALIYLLSIYYIVANFFAIGASMLWNYVVSYRWTWPTIHHLLDPREVIATEDSDNERSKQITT